MLSARLPLAIDTRRLRSFDGTEIAYHVTEAPHAGAPWIVLANGLAGSHFVWRGQIDYLRDRYRFVTWDYRGLYASDRPRPERADSYAIASHVSDLAAVLDAERIDRAAFIGWSVGVQVLLAAFPRLGARVQSLVLINGTAGRPLDALVPTETLRSAIPRALDLWRRAHAFGRSAHRPIGRAEAARWLKRLGLVGASIDDATLAEIASALGRLDLDAFLRNLRAFEARDADPSVASIDVPALIIAGDRDPLAPRDVAQQMARHIAEAELLVVRGGAHYTPLEHPELVSLRIERFYRDHPL